MGIDGISQDDRGQAVRNAIKSFVPDRETEERFIALGLKGDMKVILLVSL